ncbi:RagB/SusD family nutrient uptake outer membrane protein [Prolixibacteraceae bacterium Z1-6]|uniref:RagB/SusD family nutrient uptake outer membrane protein n=1 Tax=Draconibacterium aestuarii TaxID=2998507 RepID=A0A9X3FDJ9_9BACT|nr:RagB/SusD family nutrient uptake outer membrane protein [Prolixibacteraceae bacterium Z1-6]
MKIIKKIIALLILPFMLVSCNDWLDFDQEGLIPTEDIDFTDASQMYAPVSGVYADARRKMTQWEVWPLLNVRGDEVTKGGGSETDQGVYLDAERFSYAPVKGFWALNNAWTAFYRVVYTTYNNQILLDRFREHLTTDAQWELSDQYEAEITFHRALSYYFISNLWGDVPLVDPEDLNYAFLNRKKQETVRAFIHEELDFCIEKLPEVQAQHQGAVTKWSAMTLKAKLALQEGNYELVRSLTDDIISNAGLSLYDDYYNLFKIPGKLASESLYEFQFSDFGQGDGQEVYGAAWFQHQGPNGGIAPIAGWGFMLITEDYIDFMKGRNETDRWDVAILESGSRTPASDSIPLFTPSYQNIKGYYNGKAYLPKNQMTEGRNQYGSNNNIRMLRYADVLLMNSEAKVRLGGDAATPLNEVRNRAGLESIPSPTLEDVLDERRAEFSLEWGDRFNDLVRTGQAETVFAEYGFSRVEHEFYPIPTAQEDLNPNLKEPAVN